MHYFVNESLHQIEFTNGTIKQLFDCIEENDLSITPIEGKRSLKELANHLAIICIADLAISNGATKTEMIRLYNRLDCKNKVEMVLLLQRGLLELKDFYSQLDDTELTVKTTSYWGVTYSRFEWLLEILSHLNHHRAQLHTYLQLIGKQTSSQLFE